MPACVLGRPYVSGTLDMALRRSKLQISIWVTWLLLWHSTGSHGQVCLQVNGQQQQPNPSSVQPAAGQDCCASQAHPAKQTACQGQAAAASNSRLQPEVPNILLQDYVYKGDFGEFRETFTFLQQKENHPSMIGALQATDEKGMTIAHLLACAGRADELSLVTQAVHKIFAGLASAPGKVFKKAALEAVSHNASCPTCTNLGDEHSVVPHMRLDEGVFQSQPVFLYGNTTPLECAAAHGHVLAMKLLMQRGVTPGRALMVAEDLGLADELYEAVRLAKAEGGKGASLHPQLPTSLLSPLRSLRRSGRKAKRNRAASEAPARPQEPDNTPPLMRGAAPSLEPGPERGNIMGTVASSILNPRKAEPQEPKKPAQTPTRLSEFMDVAALWLLSIMLFFPAWSTLSLLWRKTVKRRWALSDSLHKLRREVPCFQRSSSKTAVNSPTAAAAAAASAAPAVPAAATAGGLPQRSAAVTPDGNPNKHSKGGSNGPRPQHRKPGPSITLPVSGMGPGLNSKPAASTAGGLYKAISAPEDALAAEAKAASAPPAASAHSAATREAVARSGVQPTAQPAAHTAAAVVPKRHGSPAAAEASKAAAADSLTATVRSHSTPAKRPQNAAPAAGGASETSLQHTGSPASTAAPRAAAAAASSSSSTALQPSLAANAAVAVSRSSTVSPGPSVTSASKQKRGKQASTAAPVAGANKDSPSNPSSIKATAPTTKSGTSSGSTASSKTHGVAAASSGTSIAAKGGAAAAGAAAAASPVVPRKPQVLHRATASPSPAAAWTLEPPSNGSASHVAAVAIGKAAADRAAAEPAAPAAIRVGRISPAEGSSFSAATEGDSPASSASSGSSRGRQAFGVTRKAPAAAAMPPGRTAAVALRAALLSSTAGNGSSSRRTPSPAAAVTAAAREAAAASAAAAALLRTNSGGAASSPRPAAREVDDVLSRIRDQDRPFVDDEAAAPGPAPEGTGSQASAAAAAAGGHNAWTPAAAAARAAAAAAHTPSGSKAGRETDDSPSFAAAGAGGTWSAGALEPQPASLSGAWPRGPEAASHAATASAGAAAAAFAAGGSPQGAAGVAEQLPCAAVDSFTTASEGSTVSLPGRSNAEGLAFEAAAPALQGAAPAAQSQARQHAHDSSFDASAAAATAYAAAVAALPIDLDLEGSKEEAQGAVGLDRQMNPPASLLPSNLLLGMDDDAFDDAAAAADDFSPRAQPELLPIRTSKPGPLGPRVLSDLADLVASSIAEEVQRSKQVSAAAADRSSDSPLAAVQADSKAAVSPAGGSPSVAAGGAAAVGTASAAGQLPDMSGPQLLQQTLGDVFAQLQTTAHKTPGAAAAAEQPLGQADEEVPAPAASDAARKPGGLELWGFSSGGLLAGLADMFKLPAKQTQGSAEQQAASSAQASQQDQQQLAQVSMSDGLPSGLLPASEGTQQAAWLSLGASTAGPVPANHANLAALLDGLPVSADVSQGLAGFKALPLPASDAGGALPDPPGLHMPAPVPAIPATSMGQGGTAAAAAPAVFVTAQHVLQQPLQQQQQQVVMAAQQPQPLQQQPQLVVVAARQPLQQQQQMLAQPMQGTMMVSLGPGQQPMQVVTGQQPVQVVAVQHMVGGTPVHGQQVLRLPNGQLVQGQLVTVQGMQGTQQLAAVPVVSANPACGPVLVTAGGLVQQMQQPHLVPAQQVLQQLPPGARVFYPQNFVPAGGAMGVAAPQVVHVAPAGQQGGPGGQQQGGPQLVQIQGAGMQHQGTGAHHGPMPTPMMAPEGPGPAMRRVGQPEPFHRKGQHGPMTTSSSGAGQLSSSPAGRPSAPPRLALPPAGPASNNSQGSLPSPSAHQAAGAGAAAGGFSASDPLSPAGLVTVLDAPAVPAAAAGASGSGAVQSPRALGDPDRHDETGVYVSWAMNTTQAQSEATAAAEAIIRGAGAAK